MGPILIVEDSPDMQLLIAELCDLAQIPYIKRDSGNQAIDLLRSGFKPSLVISDYNMFDGNGATLLQYVARMRTDLPFVFFTSELNVEFPLLHAEFKGVIDKHEFGKLYRLILELKMTQG